MNHCDGSARVERTRIASTCDDRAHVPVWLRTVRPVDAAPVLLRWASRTSALIARTLWDRIARMHETPIPSGYCRVAWTADNPHRIHRVFSQEDLYGNLQTRVGTGNAERPRC